MWLVSHAPERPAAVQITVSTLKLCLSLTFWRRNYFFNFSTPVYKM